MILPDHQIRALQVKDIIRIYPFESDNVQPSSYDVRFSGHITTMNADKYTSVNPLDVPDDLMQDVAAQYIYPGDFMLASTEETVGLPADIAAQFEGKSSLARLGLVVHATAGYIDPGFRGQITIEMSNVGDLPIRLTPGMLIGQIVFHKMAAPAEVPYGGAGSTAHYQYQRGPTPAHSVK